MALDLSPLELAAARAGLPGLRARVRPHDRRRPRWFRWDAAELLVSERVLDLCPPAEASALLVDSIVLRRRMLRVWTTSAVAVLVLAGLAIWARSAGSWVARPAFVALGVAAAGHFARAGRARIQADDEAVRLLGDPVPLVRGFNLMNQDELRIGRWRAKARPDLHARAERLAAKHRLRERPEPSERLRAARARVLHDG
jgi:hypothetical protein